MEKKVIIVAAGYDLPEFSQFRDSMIEGGIGLLAKGVQIPQWRELPLSGVELNEGEREAPFAVFTVSELVESDQGAFRQALAQLQQACAEVWVVTPFTGSLPANHWLCRLRVWASVEMRRCGGEAIQVLHTQGLLHRLSQMTRPSRATEELVGSVASR